MAACDPCWINAFIKSRTLGGSQVDRYHDEIRDHPEHIMHVYVEQPDRREVKERGVS